MSATNKYISTPKKLESKDIINKINNNKLIQANAPEF